MSELPFVFDTGPLSHFSEGGWLGALQYLAGEREIYIPEAVERELDSGSHYHRHLHQVLDAEWIRVDRSDDLTYTLHTAAFEQRLASGDRNRGECAVLGMAKAFNRVAVIDDGEARQLATEEGLQQTTTLALLCDGIRAGQINAILAKTIVRDLLRTKYYLPFSDADEFYAWAVENGQLEASHLGS